MSSAITKLREVNGASHHERCPSCGEKAARIAECGDCAAKMCEHCSASKGLCEVCDVDPPEEFEGCYMEAKHTEDSGKSLLNEAAGASYNDLGTYLR